MAKFKAGDRVVSALNEVTVYVVKSYDARRRLAKLLVEGEGFPGGTIPGMLFTAQARILSLAPAPVAPAPAPVAQAADELQGFTPDDVAHYARHWGCSREQAVAGLVAEDARRAAEDAEELAQ